MALAADAHGRQIGGVKFHQLAGQLVGLHIDDTGGGQQFGGGALPAFLPLHKIGYSPNTGGHGLAGQFLGGLLLLQLPTAVLPAQVQGAALHIPAGHVQLGVQAHPPATQHPAGVRPAHQGHRAGNVIEGVVGPVLALMMHQQDADVVPVSQGFQGAHVPIVAGVDIAVSIASAHLLQGVDDHQPGVRADGQELLDLFLEAMAQPLAGGLKVEVVRHFLLAQPEQPILDAGVCVLEAEVQHRLGAERPPPEFAAFGQLQTQPEAEPTFTNLAAARQHGQPAGQQIGNKPSHRRQRSDGKGSRVNGFEFCQKHFSFSVGLIGWGGRGHSGPKQARQTALAPARGKTPAPPVRPRTGRTPGGQRRGAFCGAGGAGAGGPGGGLHAVLHHIADHVDLGDLVGVAQLQPPNAAACQKVVGRMTADAQHDLQLAHRYDVGIVGE